MYGKFLHVDLGSGSFRDHVVPEEIARKYIGGKGLGVYLLDSMMAPGTGALDPGNVLIFLTGPFTGTAFPTSGRFVVVTRSPLTGMYVDSHAGGHFAKELRMAGYDGIIVTGKADRPAYLWLEDGKAELRDASDLWGKTVDDTVFAVREKTDGNARVAVIGPAGENLVPIATITMDSDSDKSRAGVAGRGGTGAVMGSKNLKAIAVRGTGSIPIAEEGPFREQVAEIVKAINANDQIHTRRIVGTSSLVESMSRTGILPSYNFQQGYFVPIYGLVSTNLRHYTKKDVACSNCPIICGKVLEDDGHPVKVEYESIALLGSNNGVGKMPLLTKAVRICNQLGLDTISAGGIAGFAMECRQRGILPEAPEFGDAEGQAKLLEDVAYRRGLGEVLANGVKAAAAEIGNDTDHFAIHVKGLELPGYEPRATWGMALAYATSDRGGCHQRAWTVLGELDGHLPRFSTEGMAKTVKTVQDERAAAYSLVVCDFAPYAQERALACLRHVTGWDISEEEYLTAGERIWNHIRMFNIREAGISRKDDTLPPRMFEDPLPMPPRGEEKVSLKREDFDRMLEEYYELRGWDSDGRPKAETVERLGIQVRI
ncbi:MAG TPA: aldehyde ferredoxin oxidoreductase family protein [Synergistales bacterium]|jgi:aldehyde:ferredoxin oxidoreductase|nr:aldehyde ferredoxin oxidoreductase family protein [Synergistales bacterium]MDI9392418.1 aldehyde ferredoxin oxidoreductase family protein [Synergistota bacterium]MDY0178805.1 aldehyde ferredoxin oxidoreductase family protein [Synergistaceae bacterium]HRW87203.1 aldehyde ferredoxin oxidoreductase family protein [Thermovirgaceae bacterium]MDD3133887.1 aldehyde ferredoxin oxidoreductase family protein [Synergistales bacterium]